ncbi:MAG: taurine ABC transporter permease [Rhodospirillaceae bacterium TMED8]|nr:taurine ABC transporter permease [Magnetovibrio sp.]OUT48086.1 MAG: taurine ABC transporter permease [Rhodospirillaceae bacterium TMED8]
MVDWFSDNRGLVAALMIFSLVVLFMWALFVGWRDTVLTSKNQVFGDPQRTSGGWYWTICGASTLMLVWFYFSWGIGRAYMPSAANDMCQVAKLDEALSPIKAALPGGARYYKSTLLVARNTAQLNSIQKELLSSAFSQAEQKLLNELIEKIRSLMVISSNPKNLSVETIEKIDKLVLKLDAVSAELLSGTQGLTPTAIALAQPKWGTTHVEIPIAPITPLGILFDKGSVLASKAASLFQTIKNHAPASKVVIEELKSDITVLKNANEIGEFNGGIKAQRVAYVKSLERIFRRLDDGTIFPANSLEGINAAIARLDGAREIAQGNFQLMQALFFPGPGVVKSRTQCSEQGSARWLPKPTDVIATFLKLANPDINSGGGYKGVPLLWWEWKPIAGFVGFFVPNWIADFWPGDYARHRVDGSIELNLKDKILQFATGKIHLGSVPALHGHLWDSVFRVLVAMILGVVLGVPLGLFMGVSRFFKSFFDPLIEIYRPVPPLAWAPLILTIFGITDDGKVFLLFMVAFAIMVISARTGASGTQLSKIRASHSLGASDRQIMWNVIFPNALPEILTGIRIAIGVCWGTLVAAEILAGTTGVGFIENIARTVSDYELIWVTILIMGILGLLFDVFMRLLIKRTIPWRGQG